MTPDGKLQKEISANREKSFYKRSVMKFAMALGWDLRFSPSRSQKLNSPFDIIEVWGTRTLKGK